MSYNSYVPYKVVRHYDRINILKNGKQPNPVHVQLIISDFCNQDCNFCAYRLSEYPNNQLFKEISNGNINNNPNRIIPIEKCLEILDDCSYLGVKAIQFTGGGEPTVHPDHIKIFNKTIENGLNFSLVTNGVIQKDGFLESIKYCDWIRFSLDASNRKTYSLIRRVNESIFDKVISNIKNVVDIKKSFNINKMKIGISFIINDDNYNEVYDASKISKGIGVDNIRIAPCFVPDNPSYHDKYHSEVIKLIKLAKQDFEDDKFKIIDMFSSRIDNFYNKRPINRMCGYMHISTYIGGDLNVYRCCNTSYNDLGLIGSIKNIRFKDLWLSDYKIKNMDEFDARSCDKCIFLEQNNIINYMIEEDPLHVNYV